MEKVSKNIQKGDEIIDYKVIKSLALNRESIVLTNGKVTFVKPAAFILGWPLSLILNFKFYYSIKII
jgi:hypothetical protein